ncbi:chromosome segregation protein SMC [Naasia sp. SYSU D00057]|uniref:chromosome segregation protein SMC n=1 Tax=Naasia sp. SYSU D00057 TaxID=2817380 RepID=UPI001B30AB3F|nr:chromosome segregation protein SMC [Naasia sp. SYSU D00057]
MYLKTLTLKGFKSFAHPTTFAFDGGVTCVVGPNGSGKSNVVDALAWVMGEQGAKSLRGGKMEDVIFAGTATKGPLGRAEVALTIDNSDGALPIEYTEVTISRTLFRNGGSEYAINGQSCRLLDVQELLSDSGLGREMHVIVGQGQLDTVLHATPADRRGFIEEAAGILKHRRRKEKTERKLESMQANLTRLSDLAGEIRRQLKPLGNQAQVAREAQTIQAAVRDARARLLADDVVALRTALADFGRTEHERGAERMVLQAELDEKSRRAAELEASVTTEEVDAARNTAFALEAAQERLRSLYTLANQRLALLGAADEAPAAEVTVSERRIEDAKAELVRLQAAVGSAARELEAARAALAEDRAALDAVDEEIAAQSAAVSRYDLELSQLTGRAEVATSRLASVRGEALRQQNALEAARERRDTARGRLAEVEAESAPAAAEGLPAAAEEAQATVDRLTAAVDQLRDALHTAERERDALSARTAALSLALDAEDGSSALAGSGIEGVRGLVADSVAVEPGWEAAIAAALGTLADAALAEDEDAAVGALRHAEQADLGRVEIVLADAAATPVATAAGGRPAASAVTAPAGVLALLAGAVLAEDANEARGLWPAARAAGVAVVTRAGEVFAPSLLRGGTGRAQSRIELSAQRDAAAARLATVTEAADDTRALLAAARADADAAKQAAKAAQAAVREAESRAAASAAALNRARASAEAAAAEHDRLAAAFTRSDEQITAAEAAVAEAKDALDAARAVPRPAFDGAARVPLAAKVDAAREREVSARLGLETARERVNAETGRIAALERRRAAELVAAEEAARRAVIRRRQIEAATAVAEELPAVLASADRSVARARVELAAAEAERSGRNRELAELRRAESELRARLHAITEQVHGLELQTYEKRLHLSGLLERAVALGLDEDVLVAEYGPDVPVPDLTAAEGEEPATRRFDRKEQQDRLAAAERKLAQLGRVNPLALEEFAALEQRHAFLTEQLADLQNTRKDLLTIIGEIDEKMQSIFLTAFEDTKAAFAEVFPILFPGGTGSIELTDPDDLLTTGIEVSVRPAGKKIERLSLLSGGERSLAAVALLVAIFKARPSPFYIMDEVEAALDDANLGRLLTIFEDLRSSSQLIVITHQKRTMEIADALYGVSMRQDGVSAVVGQRVSADREERVAS